MSHYEERLQQDIDAIRARVRELGASIEKAIDDSVRAFLTADREAASRTILGDHPINRTTRDIDRICHSFVARHLPSAGHLRFISSVMRLMVALERVGDYAVTICRETVQLKAEPSVLVLRDAELMADHARSAFRQAMKAFDDQNPDLARGTMVLADQLTNSFDKIFNDLVRDAEENKRAIADSFALLVVMNRLERISDQAKNICEEAVFTATGETKQPRVYRILFLDESDDRATHMAAMIAAKAFPESGHYASAGWKAASSLSDDVKSFMDERGFEVAGRSPATLRPIHDELDAFHVIIDLQGDARERLPDLPFHTVLLHWDVANATTLEQLHGELAGRIRELMEVLRGPDAP